MLNLVTIDQARDHLRLDYDSGGGADDGWLATWIPVVSDAVARWLKQDWRLYVPDLDSSGLPILDSNGDPVPMLDSDLEPIVAPVVRGAVLVELASQYRYREGEGDNRMESLGAVAFTASHGYILNRTSTAMLTGLRRATVR
jgi:hypothetical protein